MPVTSLSGGVRNGIVDPDWHNVSPRVGFAWSPSFAKNTVVRASGGIFYATDYFNILQILVYGPAFYTTQSLYSDPSTPTLSLTNLFPAAALGGSGTSDNSLYKGNRTPYVQEWSFNIQHTFSRDWLFSVGYMGNEGRRGDSWVNINAPRVDPTGLIPIEQRVRWPDYSWVSQTSNMGMISYNGLTAQLEKRLSSGLYFLGSYTYSHALSRLADGLDRASDNFDFDVNDKQNSDYDQRHRLILSYLYELPVGRGKRFLTGISSGAADHFVSGWKVTGITSFTTGQPQTVVLAEDWINDGPFTTSRPNKVGNPIPTQRTYNNWFNVNAYAAPGCPSTVVNFPYCGDGTTLGDHIEGNIPSRSLFAPGMNNWDLALMKDTRLDESLLLEFRAELFNAFNHVQWGTPSTTTDATFGTINSLLVNPRETQLALKLIW